MSELIDRKAAIDAMNSEGYTKNMRVHRKILSIPTIDAVPVVHGRWKDYPDCGVTACSACGWSIEECFYDPTTLKPYPYCPNCGARMDGERREG